MTEIDKINQLLAENTPTFADEDLASIGMDISDDFDWYYDENEAEVAIATCVDDYQIITNHVIDMENRVQWEDLDGVEHDTPEHEYLTYFDTLSPGQQDRYDNGMTELYEYYIKSTDEGAFHQYWYNVKTGACYERKRLLNHPEYGIILNVEGTWTELKQINSTEAIHEAYYKADFSVHPLLKELGHSEYSAYEYKEGEYNSLVENRIQFYEDVRTIPQMSVAMRYGGLKMLEKLQGNDRDKYIAAVKIANRHHYVPSDMSLWMDYIETLINLDKDVHNPFYVCPADLTEAHNKWHKKYMDVLAKRELEKKMKEIITRNNDYLPRISPFLTLAWHTDQYAVFVCPSVEDMVEEGVKMHHCVGSMGYDKKPDSLILFCRTPNGERISTIEYSISQGKVLQNRAACNKVPLYMDEVNKMLEADADKIRKCKLINIKQQQPTAMAA